VPGVLHVRRCLTFACSTDSFLLFVRAVSALRGPVQHTRTLSLEAVRPSIYTVLPPRWLHDILVRFPRLRELRVRDFPFFDDAALLSVQALPQPHEGLLRLSAPASCNSTAGGLCELLRKLPRLQALDLSGCGGAGSPAVLRCIPSSVRALSLRDLDLTDEVWRPAAKRLGLGVRSLDVRGNSLTDSSAQLLLDYSFAPPGYLSSFVMEEAGLTRLRIADNSLTVAGAIKLIMAARLVTLDLGTPLGDPAGLVPPLHVYASRVLRTLRAPHGVVTAPNGLRRRLLPRLTTLVLCAVPEWMEKRQAETLVRFVANTTENEGDCLQVLELEMVTQDAGGSVLDGEFSFFDGEQEGGSSWAAASAPAAEERVETLKRLKKVRDAKAVGWQGSIRVVRDLGGRESHETGVEGERWSLVREGY